MVGELVRFTTEQAEPFFQRWQDPQHLIDDPGTPLRRSEREALLASLSGQGNSAHMARSFSLLGL